MRFKRRLRELFACTIALFACVSCGSKKPTDHSLQGQATGCYDQLGDRVGRYFDGTIDNGEWQDTFNCVHDQITFFRKYVQGSVPGGYNQADIAALVRRFLITSRPVSDAFIASIFDIKASVFGGAQTTIAPTEIDEFLQLSEVLRKETTTLLPYLQAKHSIASAANLLALSDGVTTFGSHLADYFRTLKGTIDVSKDSFLPFAREFISISGGDPKVVDKYGDFVRNMKVVVAGGTAEVIEAATWPAIIQEGSAVGGLVLAYHSMDVSVISQPGEEDQFRIDLVHRAQVTFNQIIALHGTGIPMDVLYPVIDTLPFDSLTPEKRTAIKTDLPQIVARSLKGGVPGWFTSTSIAAMAGLFESGMRQQIAAKKIYATIPASNTRPDEATFEVAARAYLGTLTDAKAKADVNALLDTAKTFVGLLPEEGSRVFMSSGLQKLRTRNDLVRMSWYRQIMRYALSVYATGPVFPTGIREAQTTDLQNLVLDFLHILREYKLARPTVTPLKMAHDRFREANLFMPISNGDTYMDDIEGSYYIAFIFSASAFGGDIFDQVTQNSSEWGGCPIVGVDELNQDAVAPQCFRDIFFGHADKFWGNFPDLLAEWNALDVNQKADLAKAIEIASRTKGYSNDPIGPFDINSTAALVQYVEDVFIRFDANGDKVLDKREILDHAYPVFKQTLAGAVPKSIGGSDLILKGILTFIVKYGRAPTGALELLGWIAREPFTEVTANRLALFKVVALLTKPITIGGGTTTTDRSNPLGDTNLFPTTVPVSASH
jgi:hypothetical protein